MTAAPRRGLLAGVATAACVLSAAACGVTRAPTVAGDLVITAANLTSCAATVPASPPTCEVSAVISNAGHTTTTLDYARLLLRDAKGGSYPPVAPTGIATLAAGGSLPVTLSFVIFEGRTPTQLELQGVDGGAGPATAALGAGPVTSPAPTPTPTPSPSPARPSPHKPRVATTSSAAPATSTAPVYVPPPTYYAPPPAYYAPPPDPVSGGFGNG